MARAKPLDFAALADPANFGTPSKMRELADQVCEIICGKSDKTKS